MSRPVLLDLFCGEGGAAVGYHRAGYEVVGIDHVPQPRYPYEFHPGDALALGRELLSTRRFTAVHASPPCQAYASVTRWRGQQDNHPELVEPTRDLLTETGLPWIIENVVGAPIRPDYVLCGSHFGLKVRRHRWFETSWHGYTLLPTCRHHRTDLPFMHKNERAFADALGCTWMSNKGGRQAIPPAYTHFLGEELFANLQQDAA